MNTNTYTTDRELKEALHLEWFIIFPDTQKVYSYHSEEMYESEDLNIDDLSRLHSDLINEIGPDQAGQVMEQLTANK
jgi:hypothetical protein